MPASSRSSLIFLLTFTCVIRIIVARKIDISTLCGYNIGMRISTEANSSSAIELQETVTKNVRMLIAAQSVSQEELADALGVAQSGLSRKVNRKTDWTASDIANLSNFFGISFAEIVTPMGLFSVRNNDEHYLVQSTSDSSQRQLAAPAGARYLRKPDETEERGQAKGPRMFIMPDLVVDGYTEKALRHSPQSRLMMGSPTWTRTKTKGSKDPCAAITPWGNGTKP